MIQLRNRGKMALLLLMWAVAGCGRVWPGNFSGSSSLVEPTPSGPTATLSVVAGEFIAGTAEQATLNVTLLDASGNPMAGITPTLDISGVGNVQSCGSTSPIGSTSCTITSTTVGIKAVTVTTPQVNSNTVNVTGLPGETFRYVWNAQTDATLPLVSGRPYNFTVYWGDGTSSEITSAVDSDRTHTYASPGLKTITLSGTYDQFQFATHPERVMDVTRWGTTVWYSMSAMFKNAVNLNSFTATDIPDTSAVTQFSEVFMGAILFNGDVTQWNTNSATHMQRMFKGAVAFNRDISELPGGIWNVSGVLDFSEMFSASISDFTVLNTPVYTPMVFNQNISAWGMNSAINTEKMFAGCESFNQNLNGWFTGNITDMSFMFMHAKAFNSDMSAWDVSRVISFEGMFQGASNFNGNISGWMTDSATTLKRMFALAPSFNIDISAWDTTQVRSLYETFHSASSFNQPIGTWNTSMNLSLYRTFMGATNFNQDLSGWDTFSVTDMHGTFLGAFDFNNGGIPFYWNTANVTRASSLFSGARSFNQPLLKNGQIWNFGQVTTMTDMFRDAPSFNQDLDSWVTSSVTNMRQMFDGATAFNGQVGSWDTSRVTSFYGMFLGASSFNQAVGNWDVSNVTNFGSMFYGATQFNQDLKNWTPIAATTMSHMFFDAASFNQNEACGDSLLAKALNWNTGFVTDMGRMFEGAICFNHRPMFITGSVTDMSKMFSKTARFNQPLVGWDVTRVTDMSGIFDSATAFDQDLNSWQPNSVVRFSNAFRWATSFNNLGTPLNWMTAAALDMSSMFFEATSLAVPVQLQTITVKDMRYMFYGATNFNQALTPSGSIWNTALVTNMSFMFFNATVFDRDISMWEVAAVTDARAFHGGNNAPGWIPSERPAFQAGVASRRMFVTSTILNGNLGGVTGADTTCSTDPSKPPTGTYKAYVGVVGMRELSPSEVDWPVAASMQYTRPDGTLITTSDSSKRLAVGTLTNPVSAVGVSYWTGFDASHVVSLTSSCLGWNSGGGLNSGHIGDEVGFYIGSATCAMTNQLLCVEQ